MKYSNTKIQEMPKKYQIFTNAYLFWCEQRGNISLKKKKKKEMANVFIVSEMIKVKRKQII